MNRSRRELGNKILAILAIVIVIALVGHIVSVISFNQHEHIVEGADESKEAYMDLGNREDSTSTWLKRDFDLDGTTVDLSAQTFDGTFFNHSGEMINSWTMRIDIQGDCFINNAWCGTMEIHQHVGTSEEKVQTLDLRKYELEDVKLDYKYDGDLLIPLSKGDYLIYYPSEKDDEVEIRAGSELTIGAIFYYLDSIDLTSYQISYYYHRTYTEGASFYVVIALIILWGALFFIFKVTEISYRRAWKAMELRRSGIAYMSDIYDIISIIDLDQDELLPVQNGDESQQKNRKASEYLPQLFQSNAADSYQELMRDFVDLTTLRDRLDKESIACEYISKKRGWCQARFFAMDRVEGEPLKKVIFTIQNIHDEKLEMEKNAERVAQSTADKNAQSSFFEHVTQKMDTPLCNMIEYSNQIAAETTEEAVLTHAREIRYEANQLLALVHKILDASRFSVGQMKLSEEAYSLKEMIRDVIRVTEDEYSRKHVPLVLDLAPTIPDRLYGDFSAIRKVLLYLLANAIKHTESGEVKLTVFGKAKEDHIHLLFSVKDSGTGMREEDLKELQETCLNANQEGNFSMNSPHFGLNLIQGILGMMNSGLQVISVYGEGCEFYFEIDQQVPGEMPAGRNEQL